MPHFHTNQTVIRTRISQKRTYTWLVVLMSLLASPIRAALAPTDSVVLKYEKELLDLACSDASKHAEIEATAIKMRQAAEAVHDDHAILRSYTYVVLHNRLFYGSSKAQEWAEMLAESDAAKNSAYGPCYVHWTTGLVQATLHDYINAQNNFNFAIEYAKKLDDVSIASIYISKIKITSSRAPEMQDLLFNAVKYSKNYCDSIATIIKCVQINGRAVNKEMFYYWKTKLDSLRAQEYLHKDDPLFRISIYFNSLHSIEAYQHAFDGNCEKALEALRKEPDQMSNCYTAIALYRIMGDKENELRERLKMTNYNNNFKDIETKKIIDRLNNRRVLDMATIKQLNDEILQYQRWIAIAGIVLSLGILAMMIYVKARNKAYKQQKDLLTNLENSKLELSSRLYNHKTEINTALNNICGLSNILGNIGLNQSLSDEQKSDISKKIRQNTDELQNRIKEMISAPDSDKRTQKTT